MDQKIINNTFSFYMDEVGDHGLTFIDENFPIFLLVGCLFEQNEYQKICLAIKELKLKIFGSEGVILHSRDIRKNEGAFQLFFDSSIKEQFYREIGSILKNAKFSIFTAVIDKQRYIESYGKSAGNPYFICLSHILEQLVVCLESIKDSVVSISIEKRGKKEDSQLLAHYNSTRDRGSFLIDNKIYQQKIVDYRSLSKRSNDIGLQVADLCAYPIARNFLNPTEPYIPFDIIKSKIRELKVFP